MSAQDKIARLPEAHRAGVGKASAEHGPGGVFLFHIGDEVLAFRRASIAEWDEYTSGVLDEARQVTATRELLEELIVYPSREDYQGLVRRQPALPMSIMSGKKGSKRSLGAWLGSGLDLEGEEL